MAFDSVRTPAGNAEQVLGGSVNYFSVAASFYAPIRVVGVVGEDFPKGHLDWLSKKNIDVSGVQIAPGKTFHWVGTYDGNMNEAKTLSTALNVFEHFDPKLPSLHTDSPYVFLANIDPVLQQRVLDQVKPPRLVACDSMNFWIAGKPDELKKTLKRVDILSVNEGEAFLLSGEKNSPRPQPRSVSSDLRSSSSSAENTVRRSSPRLAPSSLRPSSSTRSWIRRVQATALPEPSWATLPKRRPIATWQHRTPSSGKMSFVAQCSPAVSWQASRSRISACIA